MTIMKRLFIFLPILFLSYNLYAQSKAEKSPLNQEFINYINRAKITGHKKSFNGYATGYMPSPMLIHFNKKDIERLSRKSSFSDLPSAFDWRDSACVTSVKNQGPLGACWAFSTMGALESRFIILGIGTLSTDLSEQNMATCHGFEAGIDDGGSDYIAAAYLTRLSGPATEASDPYESDPNATCQQNGLVVPAFAPRSIFLPKDINIIKKVIMDYGPVTSSAYMGINYTSYKSSTDHTYYYNGVEAVDHGVLIVGWDDNMSVTGGIKSPKGTKGAWIVKNSWGTVWGDNGYYYVSYYDSKFLSSVSYFPDIIDKSEIDTLYMNDFLGATSSYGYRKETAYALEKFVAPKDNFIRKIGTFIAASGTVVDIDIYDDFQGDSLLKNPIASSHGNMCLFPGYETFDIPLKVNGDFYVRIKYFTPGYNYPIPVETRISYQGETYALPSILPSGTCWISHSGGTWSKIGSDITDSQADLCIRVYADTSTALNAYFSANKRISCINSPVTFTQACNGTVETYSWDFGEGAVPSTVSTAGPHQVNYTTPGKKNISLVVTGPGGTKTLVKNNYVEIVSQLNINLPYSEVKLVKGKSLSVTAFGADNYTWSPATGLNTTTGPTVIASPSDTTTYTVSGTIGSCTGSSTLKINVVKNPVNDNICDALLLQVGYNGPFTNVNATVEPNEPFPDTTNCNTQLTWCDKEGGLQASVWFKFVANKNTASFTTKGMDTQIALYDVPNCEAVITGPRTIIAANDDYFGMKDKYAAALNNVTLVEGKTYYLQVDGSAGGEEGEFSIIIWNAPVGITAMDNPETKPVTIYPNPTKGEIKLRIFNAPETFMVRILDITGKTILTDEISSNTGNFERMYNITEKGLYLVRITGKGINYTERIIKN